MGLVEVLNSELHLGGVPATRLVQEWGSPLFVVEEEVVLDRVKELQSAFAHDRVRLFFAGKANPNLQLWKLVGEQGLGMDCCSPGEVALALKAGFDPEDISFTGTALKEREMRFLVSSGVGVNLDAISQVERFGRIVQDYRIGIRINPNIGVGLHEHCTTGGARSKLGIPMDQIGDAIRAAGSSGNVLAGLHVHTGSGGLDVEPFLRTAETMFELAEPLAGTLEYIDLGGGIGVPHKPSDEPFPLQAYAEGVLKLLDDWNRKHARPLTLYLEPGQFIAAEAGWLLATVEVLKPGAEGRRFAILDSNFNHYLGTALYGSYHEFHKVTDMGGEADGAYEIVGNLCNTGDTFAAGRTMPRLQEGDLLGMVNAGAYGLSRSSNYNSRVIPAEVFVQDGKSRLVRRRQTYDDLLQCQE